MSYSQYTTLKSVRKNLGLSVENHSLFHSVAPMKPTDWLQQTLKKAMAGRIAFFSEKSRSEAIVFPILLELNNQNEGAFTLYSGAMLEADKEKGLNGECDFVLGLGKQNIELETPVFCIVEAKDNDIELGTPQCIAQMYGAKILNEQEGSPVPVIYGGVTTGDTWLFLKLEGESVFIDERYFYLANLEELLGALQILVETYAQPA